MQRTQIEWVKNPDGTQGYSWNPIRGLCPVDCKLPDGKSYCYAKAIYDRFEWMQEDMGEYGYLAEWELEQPIKRKKPTKIFVCSTFELFHPCTKSIRDAIFKTIESCPQHTFQILTKFPQNIDREMPDNVHLGVSVTSNSDIDKARIKDLLLIDAKIRFISFEPILDVINLSPSLLELMNGMFHWFIIGRLTGFGKSHNPRKSMIEFLVNRARIINAKVFLKNNLKSIMEENLIQEFPRE